MNMNKSLETAKYLGKPVMELDRQELLELVSFLMEKIEQWEEGTASQTMFVKEKGDV